MTIINRLLTYVGNLFRPYEERTNVDHLSDSEFEQIITPRSPEVAAERTLRTIRAHGPDSATASPALVKAAERHFGSWTKALAAAGLGFGSGSRPTIPLREET